MTKQEYILIANRIRYRLVELSSQTKTAHLGSALSCVDILVGLYWRALNFINADPNHSESDRFILSKGHAVPALFTTLASRGLISENYLASYAQPGSKLEEHPSSGSAPGIHVATGSLGHGLSFGLGLAIAARLLERKYRVYVLLGDGECNEGSTWEAAMFAPAQKIDNLIAIIDFNKWQATGRSCEIMSLQPLRDKWAAFGWHAVEIDGHDFSAISGAFEEARVIHGRPTAIVAHTIKGKGISFMEDDNDWHYRIPTKEEVALAGKELGIE